MLVVSGTEVDVGELVLVDDVVLEVVDVDALVGDVDVLFMVVEVDGITIVTIGTVEGKGFNTPPGAPSDEASKFGSLSSLLGRVSLVSIEIGGAIFS